MMVFRDLWEMPAPAEAEKEREESMQVGGVGGNEYQYDSHTHMVSKCVHGEDGVKKKTGGAAMQKTASQTLSMSAAKEEEGTFSLFQWAGKLFHGAKSLWGRIWGTDVSGQTATALERNASREGSPDGKAELRMAEMASQALPGPAMASAGKNPYFTPVNDEEAKGGLFWRLRYKVRATGNMLKKQLSAGKEDFNFNTKQEQSRKENLRKKSTYKENDLEMVCTITDDSYLMDSYNKKGVYSQISTKR